MTTHTEHLMLDRDQALQEFATNSTFLTDGSMRYELTLKVEPDDGKPPIVYEFPNISAYILRWHLNTNDYLLDCIDPDPNSDIPDYEDEEDDGTDTDDDFDLDDEPPTDPATLEFVIPINRDIIRELDVLSRNNYGVVTLAISYVQEEIGRPLMRHIIKGYIQSCQSYSGTRGSKDTLQYTLRMFCFELDLNLL